MGKLRVTTLSGREQETQALARANYNEGQEETCANKESRISR
jgi:hypothetical protein